MELLTVSSGDTCSEGDLFILYAAHSMSRDFLRVSSILQAVKSAAAAASLSSGSATTAIRPSGETYHIIVLAVRMDQSEFMIIHTCSVVCTNRASPTELATYHNPQSECATYSRSVLRTLSIQVTPRRRMLSSRWGSTARAERHSWTVCSKTYGLATWMNDGCGRIGCIALGPRGGSKARESASGRAGGPFRADGWWLLLWWLL